MTSFEKVLRCDCGFEARGEHDDELVAEVQRHAWEAHAMALTPDEARTLFLAAAAAGTAPHSRAPSLHTWRFRPPRPKEAPR